ncbi:MAG: hypothetical protein RBR08_16455, partial [Desulforegulaceae bacterium]|nr:hypothetical protein [Desulforegulaceae bacterium]
MGNNLYQVKALVYQMFVSALRDKSYLILILTGMFFFVLIQILSFMSVGGNERIIINGGFFIIGFFGLVTSLYYGINIINGEIKNKTYYLIISRGVTKNIFITGKIIGIFLNSFCVFIVLNIFFILSLISFTEIEFNNIFIISVLFIFLEWMVLGAFSLLFACFTSSLLHVFFLTGIYFAG